MVKYMRRHNRLELMCRRTAPAYFHGPQKWNDHWLSWLETETHGSQMCQQ